MAKTARPNAPYAAPGAVPQQRPDVATTRHPAKPILAELRILETTDLHMQIMPYDYFADRPAPATGLALTATLIRQARAEVADCLLFDNGDFLQGNPMSDWAAETDAAGGAPLHPMMAVMNALDYDGAALGNHEFNYGLKHLARTLRQANFPVLSANVVTALGATPPEDTPLVPPWTILNRAVLGNDGQQHPIRIGVIGLTPPQTTAWERFTLDQALKSRDMLDATRPHVEKMRFAGADIVIALAHCGIGADVHTPGMENAAVPLAAIPGIDVVLAGHTHNVFPGTDHPATAAVDPVAGTLHGKPAVMAGAYGSHLGIIDLTLELTPQSATMSGETRWRITRHCVRAVPVAARPVGSAFAQPVVAPDRAVLDAIGPVHSTVLDTVRSPIARTSVPLSTHFDFAAPSAALTVVADIVRRYLRQTIAAKTLAGLPLVAAIAPYKAGGQAGAHHFVSIAVGPLAVRHASELYPFPNGLCLLRLTGRAVAAWLEISASAFAQIAPGCRDQPLRNEAVPCYNFDVIHGLRYAIDPSAKPGGRISEVQCADGTPLHPDAAVLVATNGYRAGGGGGFAAALRGELVYSERRPLRDVLIDGLRTATSISPRPEPVWRFASVPGASAWFDAGAEAEAFFPAVAAEGPHLRRIGPTADGFQRYCVDFDGSA